MENTLELNKKNKPDIKEKPLSGLERSLAVLNLMADFPRRVIDIKKEMNLPWATAHRTVKKLEKAEFLIFNPETSKYEIGPRLWHLGSCYLANNKMLKASITHLAQDRTLKDIDIQIVERIGDNSVVIHAEKRQVNEISMAQYGYPIPLHAGSKGLVLLAFESEKFIKNYLSRDLPPLTNHTLIDKNTILKRLKEIKDSGFAQTKGDVQNFTGSIAAPIFGQNRKTLGCVCFVYLNKVSNDKESMDQLKESLLIMAHSISVELGWNPSKSSFSR